MIDGISQRRPEALIQRVLVAAIDAFSTVKFSDSLADAKKERVAKQC
jgi:hypothetical protein